MRTVGVIGLGNWGTALASHLAGKGHAVTGWDREAKIIDGINREHRNPLYLPDARLPANLRAVSDIAEAAACEALLLVVPSSSLRDVCSKLTLRPDTLVVSAIKGFEHDTLATPLQFVGERFPDLKKTAVLSGPSFAADLIRRRPLGVVAASRDEETAREVGELFSGESMRVYLSTDPLGVELGGAVKNVIAVAAGACDGLELGDSARAGLITRGLAEMMRLAVALGADARTLSGLSGLGDLAMTATSPLSRNRTVGYRLGKGETLETIQRTLGSVAEAVRTSPLILELANRHGVTMPITEAVVRVLRGEATPEEAMHQLLARPMKREF